MEPVRTIIDLEKRGFDVEEGIVMCAGDEEIYLEVLDAALEEGSFSLPSYIGNIRFRHGQPYFA